MRYLITGSSGFLGAHVAKRIIKEGNHVCILPRETLYNPPALKRAVEVGKPDFVIVAHAYGNMSFQIDPTQIFDGNVRSLFNLYEALLNVPYGKLVYISSSSVTLPKQTLYAVSKLMGESLTRHYGEEYGKPNATVRPYSIYGEAEADHRFIPTVFRSCLTGEGMELSPDAVHDWIYVGDVVTGILSAEVGGTVELGSGGSYTNEQIVENIETLTGKKANIREYKVLRSFDTDRWVAPYSTATVSLEEGLTRCYGYYKKRYNNV